MQALLEFSPLLVFIAAYYLRDLYFATAALMVAMVVLVVVDWLRKRRVPKMHLLSAVLVLAFGSATLLLRDAHFIQWKPTIFMWILAVAFLVSSFVGAQPLAQRLLQPAIADREVPRRLWLRLNLLWVVFYAALGLANIYVAQHASERVWVNFKVIGLTAASLVFVMCQGIWLNSIASPAPGGGEASK